jgi:hypothetical protein
MTHSNISLRRPVIGDIEDIEGIKGMAKKIKVQTFSSRNLVIFHEPHGFSFRL